MRFVIACGDVDPDKLLNGTRRFPCVRANTNAPLSTRGRAVLSGNLTTLNISDFPSWGAVGCSLSHIELWRRLVQSPYQSMVVFEEDALLTRSKNEIEDIIERAESLPYDVFWLGLRFPLETIFEKRTSYVEEAPEFRWVHSHFWETHAYIIRKSAARTLLRNALPLDVQIDAYMCMQMKSQNLKFMCHESTLAKQPTFGILTSSIQASVLTQCGPCRLPTPFRSVIFAFALLTVVIIALVLACTCRRR